MLGNRTIYGGYKIKWTSRAVSKNVTSILAERIPSLYSWANGGASSADIGRTLALITRYARTHVVLFGKPNVCVGGGGSRSHTRSTHKCTHSESVWMCVRKKNFRMINCCCILDHIHTREELICARTTVKSNCVRSILLVVEWTCSGKASIVAYTSYKACICTFSSWIPKPPRDNISCDVYLCHTVIALFYIVLSRIIFLIMLIASINERTTCTSCIASSSIWWGCVTNVYIPACTK